MASRYPVGLRVRRWQAARQKAAYHPASPAQRQALSRCIPTATASSAAELPQAVCTNTHTMIEMIKKNFRNVIFLSPPIFYRTRIYVMSGSLQTSANQIKNIDIRVGIIMQSIHQFVSALFHNTCCIDPSDPIQQSGHIRIKGIHLFLCHVGVLPYRIHRNKISRCSSGRPPAGR